MKKTEKCKSLILVDAHVHIYPYFEAEKLFTAAFNNFEKAATAIDKNSSYTAVLLLSETNQDNYFNYLATLSQNNSHVSPKLQIKTTRENCSLILQEKQSDRTVYLIAGRQIVTAENLEVLALATEDQIEDGKPIETVIEQIIKRDGIPVIPWGFGKWIGPRGSILKKLLTNHKFPYLFLGDNSNRPNFWFSSPYFKLARQQNIQILPGSDPLPFAAEYSKTGSFGFSVRRTIDTQTPAQSIKQILFESDLEVHSYGSLETSMKFIKNQIAMQIIKRQREK